VTIGRRCATTDQRTITGSPTGWAIRRASTSSVHGQPAAPLDDPPPIHFGSMTVRTMHVDPCSDEARANAAAMVLSMVGTFAGQEEREAHHAENPEAKLDVFRT
jgi:hypothetical protein